jgi:hypothetical protein
MDFVVAFVGCRGHLLAKDTASSRSGCQHCGTTTFFTCLIIWRWASGWPTIWRLKYLARARRIAPVIPHKANEKNKPKFFAKALHKACARIEQGVGTLKRFKRVSLRCEKTARIYSSFVSFACALCLIKFVHTA